MPAQLNDLADLVDDPVESLAVEYKALVDFTDVVAKAKLARHIAALANHGGGHIVVGFNDDLSPAAVPTAEINRDLVASVVKAYLDPPVHCDVRHVTAQTGRTHPVIIVPSHAATPICVRADGPQIGGRVQGIQRGAYYIRKAGPASEAILTPAEWAPLIRRCALYERTAILSAIDIAIRGATPEMSLQEHLSSWHAAAAKTYLEDFNSKGAVSDLAARHFQFSYLIQPSEGGPRPAELLEVVERASNAVEEKIFTGWPMFHVFRAANGTHFVTKQDVDRGETEFLETNYVRNGSTVGATDLWRFSLDGRATILRGYFEDSWWRQYGIEEGQAFSPNQLVRNLAEFVMHAATMATAYPGSSQILFQCEWLGLQGRVLHDFHGRWQFAGHPAQEDRRVVRAAVGVGEAVSGWASVVETLAGPVARAFGIGHVVTADWIAGQQSGWRRG